jgi:hypothetical protein
MNAPVDTPVGGTINRHAHGYGVVLPHTVIYPFLYGRLKE